MKTYRLVTLVAAALITMLFAWALTREDIGAKQEHAIESSLS